jgi:hypothetical protein
LRGVASPYGSQPSRLHCIPDWCYAILILPPFLASPISVPITEAGSGFDFLSLVGYSWSRGRAGSFVSVGTSWILRGRQRHSIVCWLENFVKLVDCSNKKDDR